MSCRDSKPRVTSSSCLKASGGSMGQGFKQYQNKKAAAVFAAGLLLFAIYCGLSYYRYVMQTLRQPPSDIIVFENFPEDLKFEAYLENRSGVSPVSVSDGVFTLSDAQKKNFKLPYVITAKLTKKDKTYDLKWNVDKDGVEYALALAGFKPSDQVSFSLNGSTSVSNVEFDWSGRLTFDAFMIKDQDMIACAAIKGTLPLDFCHKVTGRKGAV